MKILIDETGKFELKSKNDFAIITLVSIPSSEEKPLLKLLSKIQKNYPHRKIKGTKIRFPDRVKIFDYLKNMPFIKYSSVFTGGIIPTKLGLQRFRKLQVEKINKSIELPRKIKNLSLVKDLELFRNQIDNLSMADFTRFFIIVDLIIKWQGVFLYDYLGYPQSKETWDVDFVLHTLNKPQKMKRILKSFIKLTTNRRNPQYAIFLPEEWSPTHKFISKYDTKDGLNAKKIYENFDFYTEEQQPLLKIPDIIGNSFFRLVNKPDNIAYTELIKMLKNNRSLYMTLKSKRNYFVVTGFNKALTGKKPHHNIRLIHKNLNFSLSDFLRI